MTKNILLQDFISSLDQEEQARIQKRTVELREQNTLAQMREFTQLTQQAMANILGISQPTIVKMEKKSNDPKLSTLKRYAQASGSELILELKKPDGETVTLDV